MPWFLRCSVLQWFAVSCNVLQVVTVSCSELQWVVVSCSGVHELAPIYHLYCLPAWHDSFYSWHECVTSLILRVTWMHNMTYSMCDVQHQGGDTASTAWSSICVTWIILYVPWMRDMTHSAWDMTYSKRDMQHQAQGGDTASTAVPCNPRFQRMHVSKSPPKLKRMRSSEYVSLSR